MNTPGFSPEQSLYTSRMHYRTTGAVPYFHANVSPMISDTSLEIPNANDWLGISHDCRWTSSRMDARWAGEMFAPDARGTVLPMGVPAHASSPGTSGSCNDCFNWCQIDYPGCWVLGLAGCAPLLEVPFVGSALYLVCAGAALVGCLAWTMSCEQDCEAVGAPCCPAGCGSSCCDYGERCSSTAAGLCCSSGTTPCGTMCCTGNETCSNGMCCPGTVCADGTCCDNTCGQCLGGICVPVQDGTACPNGTCCGGTCSALVNDSNNCAPRPSLERRAK
jgi:hypothetical protein